MTTALKKLCVFCGSSSGRDSIYVEEAKALGEYLASEKIQLTYGGGSIGLMGAIANAAYDEGQNRVLGIIPVGLCPKAHALLPVFFLIAKVYISLSAVKKRRRNGHISICCEAITDLLNVGIDTKNFLNDDEPALGPTIGVGPIG